LALVFGRPLSRRLLDDSRSKSRPFSRRVRGVRHPPVAERIPSVSARRATEESPCGRLSLAINRRSNINRAVGAFVPAPPLAFPRRGRSPRPRSPRCPGRDCQLGRGPPLYRPGAVRTERPPLREGHRFLSLLASRLRRTQELDAADARVVRPCGRRS